MHLSTVRSLAFVVPMANLLAQALWKVRATRSAKELLNGLTCAMRTTGFRLL